MLYYVIFMFKLADLAGEQDNLVIPDEFLKLIKIAPDKLADFEYQSLVEYDVELKYDDDTEIKPIEIILNFEDMKDKVEKTPDLSASVLNICSNFLINVMKPHDILRNDDHYNNLVAEVENCKNLFLKIEEKNKAPAVP